MKINERVIGNEAEAVRFIDEQVRKIKRGVGKNKAICFVSGGVDSSVVAVLGRRAIGKKNFQPVMVENGLMREGEIESTRDLFEKAGIPLKVADMSDWFFVSLRGKVLPYDKRTAIRMVFYSEVLSELVKKFSAKFFLQGTILTDIEATVKNSAAPQHNVLKQIGLNIGDVEIIEPLAELRKPSVRIVAKALGLPESIWNRMPFPGPALAARIVGEVTREKVEVIRKVTAVIEKELSFFNSFQYLATLVSDNVPNNDRTKLGYGVVIECISSTNAVTAQPTYLSMNVMCLVRDRIYAKVPEVFKVAWDISTKPPAAVEWV